MINTYTSWFWRSVFCFLQLATWRPPRWKLISTLWRTVQLSRCLNLRYTMTSTWPLPITGTENAGLWFVLRDRWGVKADSCWILVSLQWDQRTRRYEQTSPFRMSDFINDKSCISRRPSRVLQWCCPHYQEGKERSTMTSLTRNSKSSKNLIIHWRRYCSLSPDGSSGKV